MRWRLRMWSTWQWLTWCSSVTCCTRMSTRSTRSSTSLASSLSIIQSCSPPSMHLPTFLTKKTQSGKIRGILALWCCTVTCTRSSLSAAGKTRTLWERKAKRFSRWFTKSLSRDKLSLILKARSWFSKAAVGWGTWRKSSHRCCLKFPKPSHTHSNFLT